MNKLTEFEELIFASFLHDLGKFYLRAGGKLIPSDERDGFALQTYTRNTGSEYQPRYKYYHAALTEKFSREYLPRQLDNACHLAALHHIPANASNERHKLLASLITLADWLSSGERIELEDDMQTDSRTEPLLSIFSQLKTCPVNMSKENSSGQEGAASNNPDDYFIPLSPLDDKMENLFPVVRKEEAFASRDYQMLWQDFITELKRLRTDDNYLTQLYYLLQKYLLTIPSAAFKEKADISLFHHLKTTAAITACLYRLIQTGRLGQQDIETLLEKISSYNQAKRDKSSLQTPDVLSRADIALVGGDISGIQSFLYEVTSEKALKGLRARSFYIQLISEVLARSILKEFDLPETNLLYCGGGNFYLLIPALNDFEQKLKAIQKKFDSILLAAHRGKLSIVLSWWEVNYLNFIENFAECWHALSTRLNENKKRKFASLLDLSAGQSMHEKIFGPFDEGGEKKGCSICGQELTGKEIEICTFCTSLIDLATKMKDAEVLVVKSVKQAEEQKNLNNCYEVIAALGYEARFTRYQDRSDGDSRYLPGALLLNSTDFAGRTSGFYFLPNKTYSPDGIILTLEKMAEEAKGIEKWGVLKADVDNLGWLFKEGLGENKTISRISMLSFMLSAYFGGRLSQIKSIEKSADYSRPETRQIAANIYIAYSGGDDLFLIGPWSDLHELAWIIYQDFRKFTCNRLTLSAGIYYAPSKKFPIYQAADKVGEAVELSKGSGRNRLTLFETPVPWSAYHKIKEIYELTEELLKGDGQDEKKIHRSLLNILYSIYQEKEFKARNKILIERIWRLHYAIGKLSVRLGRDDLLTQKIHKLVNMVVTNYEIYPYLNIATRVADYLTRKA
ncbi:MAG: type III-A CRISPR-associated protein Cas10/Csm1 [Candidatus Saccharicenans sp.]|nr:type III-A CRISPR-associated protein Cas10/Csm1 [Candidatus Saccharicenans sp.]